MIDRRNFLSLLGAVMVMDPERLLWKPDKKRIFIPKPKVVASTTHQMYLPQGAAIPAFPRHNYRVVGELTWECFASTALSARLKVGDLVQVSGEIVTVRSVDLVSDGFADCLRFTAR